MKVFARLVPLLHALTTVYTEPPAETKKCFILLHVNMITKHIPSMYLITSTLEIVSGFLGTELHVKNKTLVAAQAE